MADQTESEHSPVASAKPTALAQFLQKVVVVSVAALGVLFISVWYVSSTLEDLLAVKGGTAFWSVVELKLYKLADEPDLPPEKKAKIIKALTKLSAKYHPYVEALVSPAPKDRVAEGQIR